MGADIEHVDERRDLMRLARFAFDPSEVTQLQGLRPQLRIERFYTLWTLKEACVKAFGLSLLKGLRCCVFEFDAGWRERGRIADDWNARVYRPRPDLYLAVVASPAAPALTGREWPAECEARWPLIAEIQGQL